MSAVRIQSDHKDGVEWKKIFFILLLALSINIFLFFFDTPIWHAARDLVEPDYLYIAKLLTDWGLYLFYAVFAGFWIYAFIKKNRNLINVGLAYLKAQIIFSLVVVRIIKVVLGRARPGYGTGFTFLETSDKFNAFPSGHAADAFVSGVFLYYLLKQTKYPGFRFLPLIYAFLIAVSRVFVSAHYPSDVAAGITIGILGAWFFIYRSRQERN
jgi:membrane-associated phospholipid phosphatase